MNILQLLTPLFCTCITNGSDIIITPRGGRGDFAGHNNDEIQEPLVV